MINILKVISICFGTGFLSAPKYHLFKYTDKSSEDTVFFSFFQVCEKYLEDRNHIGIAERCNCDADDEGDCLFYVSVNVDYQIDRLLKNPSLANEIMTYRFQWNHFRPDSYTDIYDGSEYKALLKNK